MIWNRVSDSGKSSASLLLACLHKLVTGYIVIIFFHCFTKGNNFCISLFAPFDAETLQKWVCSWMKEMLLEEKILSIRS